MPTIRVNDSELYYEDTGGSGTPIVFCHGLLWNVALFAPQIAALKGRYRCVAYDHRGQGRSADGTGRAIDMGTLTADATALIEALGLGRVHFCGLSMGGFIAMRLGINRPDLVRSLLLLETSADAEPPGNRPKYRALNLIARLFGFGLVADSLMKILYGQTVLKDPTRAADRAAWRRQLMSNRRSIWRAVNGVIERPGIYGELGKIGAPTLVMVGEEDVATVPAKAQRIADAIKGAKLVRIPQAGHSATVEQPAAVNAAIIAFLDGIKS